MQTRFRITFCVITSLSISGCGTEVDVGRNSDPDLFAGLDDGATDGSSSINGGNQNSSNALALNCVGEVPTAELSAHATAICSETPNEMDVPFARAMDRLCQRRDIVRMMEAGCGWDGQGKIENYFRVLERTDLKDRAVQEFSMLSAFSVVIPRTPDEYLFGFYKGYDDPEFKSKLKKLDAFKLSNVKVDRSAGTVDYSVEAQTSAATAKFRGHVKVRKLSSGMVAIYDQAVADKVIVKEQRYLILLVPIDSKNSVVMAVDDKIVEDLGNHQIAYSTAIKINKERMELTHAVANYNAEAK